MMERKLVTVSVFDKERYDGVWPPEAALEFMAWFQEKLNSIPAEYRDHANVDIDSTTSYGEPYARLRISYTRPETDAELAQRLAELERRKDLERQRDLATLAALKAKYGDASSPSTLKERG